MGSVLFFQPSTHCQKPGPFSHSREGLAWVLSMLKLGRLVTLPGSPLAPGRALRRQEGTHMELETSYLATTDGIELLQDIACGAPLCVVSETEPHASRP